MLNGVDPIIIFGFKKLLPSAEDKATKIPLVAADQKILGLPAIPIYLSEKLTGICIESEDKSVAIDTELETLTDASNVTYKQRGLASSVKIGMIANRDSIGIALLSALIDRVFPLVTSKEYSISYLHGTTVIIDGLLHDFTITQNSTNELCNITLELSYTNKKIKQAPPLVPNNPNAVKP